MVLLRINHLIQKTPLQETLIMVICTLDMLMSRTDIIPHTWFGISMFQYSTISQVIRVICQYLKKCVPKEGEEVAEPGRLQQASVSRRRTKGITTLVPNNQGLSRSTNNARTVTITNIFAPINVSSITSGMNLSIHFPLNYSFEVITFIRDSFETSCRVSI